MKDNVLEHEISHQEEKYLAQHIHMKMWDFEKLGKVGFSNVYIHYIVVLFHVHMINL